LCLFSSFFPCYFFFSFIYVGIINLEQERGLKSGFMFGTLVWSKKRIWKKIIACCRGLGTLV
jgi:hypothetical protein